MFNLGGDPSEEWRREAEKKRQPVSKFLLWVPGVYRAGRLQELVQKGG